MLFYEFTQNRIYDAFKNNQHVTRRFSFNYCTRYVVIKQDVVGIIIIIMAQFSFFFAFCFSFLQYFNIIYISFLSISCENIYTLLLSAATKTTWKIYVYMNLIINLLLLQDIQVYR